MVPTSVCKAADLLNLRIKGYKERKPNMACAALKKLWNKWVALKPMGRCQQLPLPFTSERGFPAGFLIPHPTQACCINLPFIHALGMKNVQALFTCLVKLMKHLLNELHG